MALTAIAPALIIVGLGKSSIGIARAAKRLGLLTIGIDRDPSAAGSRHVDFQEQRSSFSTKPIGVPSGSEAIGVVCSSSDARAQRAAAAMSERLGVVGPSANFCAIDDKLALSTALASLAPDTNPLRPSGSSPDRIIKPRFGHGLASTEQSDGEIVNQKRILGEEFVVSGIVTSTRECRAPTVVLRKVVRRSNRCQKHVYWGTVRDTDNGARRIMSGDKSFDEQVSLAWAEASRALKVEYAYFSVDCIVESRTRGIYVIDAGLLWDLGLEYLLPVLGVDVQEQLVRTVAGIERPTPSASSFLAETRVKLEAKAQSADGASSLLGVGLSKY